jgi:hypothetical protein
MAAVTWNRGPWATRPTRPYQYLTEQRQQRPSFPPYEYEAEPTDGSGRGGKGITATNEYGPMTMSEIGNMWGGSLASKAVSTGVNAAMGTTPTAMGFLGLGPKAGVTLASAFSSLLGGVRGTDDEFGLPTAVELQAIQDEQGVMAAQEAARSAMAERASRQSMQKEISGALQPGFAEDPENPDPGWGGGGEGEGEGESTDASDPGSNTGGTDHGGPGGATYARGGVSRVTRPTRARYGEGGEPETAIFIPESMKRRGFQGRERQVRRGLKRAYSSLT